MRNRKQRVWDGEEMIFSYETNCCSFSDAADEYQNRMDSTDLLDKSEKEIFEGDIISHGETVVEVKFVKIYGWFPFFDVAYFGVSSVEYEIIGNIHQSPELLTN